MFVENPTISSVEIWRLIELLGAAALLSIISYFLSRRHGVAGVVFLVLPFLITGGLLQEFHDPATGTGIRIANGTAYYWSVYTAALLLSAAPLLSVFLGFRKRHEAGGVTRSNKRDFAR